MLGLSAAQLLLALYILVTSRPDGISARPNWPGEALDHDLQGRPARGAASWCAHNRALLRKRGLSFGKSLRMEETVTESAKEAELQGATSSNVLQGLHGDAQGGGHQLPSEIPAQKDGQGMSHRKQLGDDVRRNQREDEKKQQQGPENQQILEEIEKKQSEDLPDRKQHEDAVRKRQDENKKQQEEAGRDGQQQEHASQKIQQEPSEGKLHAEEAEKNIDNEGDDERETLKDGGDKEKEGGSTSESKEGNDGQRAGSEKVGPGSGKGGPGSESTAGEDVEVLEKLDEEDLAEERQRFLNMEHGKKKPPSGFVRAMKSAWQKIKEGLAITWNRLVNLLCKRKRSSIHPDGLPEKLLIKKAPFNPNEPLHHKVARKAEYNQLRPPKAPENQKDPPYTIPSRTAEAPPQPSSALVEFAFEPPKDQHHDV